MKAAPQMNIEGSNDDKVYNKKDYCTHSSRYRNIFYNFCDHEFDSRRACTTYIGALCESE